MRLINILFLVLIVTASCRRKGDASGKVINLLSGQPVAGIKVNLDEYKIKMITDKTVTRPIANATTDSNGEYTFSYGARLGRNGSNRLITIDSDYFTGMDTVAMLDEKYEIGNYPGCEKAKWDYSGHSRKNQDFFMVPLSRIKVIPKNVTNTYNGVTLRIELYDDNYSKPIAYYKDGNISGADFYSQFPSNGKVYVLLNLEGYKYVYDTIYVAPFAKTTYYFNY